MKLEKIKKPLAYLPLVGMFACCLIASEPAMSQKVKKQPQKAVENEESTKEPGKQAGKDKNEDIYFDGSNLKNVNVAGKPNVLLIMADDMNYSSPGIFGSQVEAITPNIDKLSSQGTRFTNAHVTAAICMPSRQALMTGRYPHRSGALGFDPINMDVPTLQEQLNAGGYTNGIIGKETHLKPFEKYPWNMKVRTLEQSAGWGRDHGFYYKHIKNFIKKSKELNSPFFLMANSNDPHRPFAGSEEELQKFGVNTKASRVYKPEEVKVPSFLPDIPDVRKEIAEYFTSVHRLDDFVGMTLKILEEEGISDNTIVMFLSDNGMALPFAKTNCYLNSTKTPWIIRWPSVVKAGRVESKHMISGVDFMATILDMCGMPQVQGMDGKSFFPVLKGEKQEGRDKVFTFINTQVGKLPFPMRCIQSQKFGYIYNAWSDGKTIFKNESKSGLSYKAMKEAAKEDAGIAARIQLYDYRVKEEFYDFEKDPDALHNLINDKRYAKQINKMRLQLLQNMESTNDYLVDQYKKDVAMIY